MKISSPSRCSTTCAARFKKAKSFAPSATPFKLLAFVFSFGAFAQDLSHSREWLKLLHYQHSNATGFQSDISNREFFLSPNGFTSPESELAANLNAFRKSETIGNDKAACLFPARLAFLQRHFPELKTPSCPAVENWVDHLKGESVALVFSSYFQGSPGSMFGHTFLKINRGAKDSVLDFAIDYSAITGGDNVVWMSLKGLFGLYHGAFSPWPYYVKMKEYNNAENRDVFEYYLNFNREETRFLLLHVFEMNRAKIRYTFLMRNCSYEILSVLEAAKPNWHLSDRFKTHVLPVDTVRVVLEQEHALTEVRFKPSLKSKLRVKFDHLPRTERSRYFDVIERRSPPGDIQDPLLAETLGLHYAIRTIEDAGHLKPDEAELAHSINLRRSLLPTLNEDAYKPEILPRPDLAHGSSNFSLGSGVRSGHGAFVNFGGRLALHSMLDNDTGYSHNSNLEALAIHARQYIEDARLALENFTLLKVVSLNPVNRLESPWSYEFQLALVHPDEASCLTCTAARIRVGLGKSIEVGPVTAFTLVTLQADAAGYFNHSFRVGPGVSGGAIYKESSVLKTLLEAEFQYFGNQKSDSNLGTFRLAQSYSWSRKTETHMGVVYAGDQLEASLSQQLHF